MPGYLSQFSRVCVLEGLGLCTRDQVFDRVPLPCCGAPVHEECFMKNMAVNLTLSCPNNCGAQLYPLADGDSSWEGQRVVRGMILFRLITYGQVYVPYVLRPALA